MQLAFSILSWGAWSPEYPESKDWQHWHHAPTAASLSSAAPKLEQIPAMQRRRFSRLSKMMLEAAFRAEPPPQCRSVFASRHGELHRTVALLEELLAQQPLSPMGFSQSVHNTASGLYGMVTQNQAPSTSIAAGSDTLSQALIEAWGQLADNPAPLLFVFGDEPVPSVYREFIDELEYPLALALVLAPATQAGEAKLLLSTTPNGEPLSYGDFLQALSSRHPLAGQLAGMHWQLQPEVAC